MISTHEKILQGIRKYLDIGVRHFIGLNNDAILGLFDSGNHQDLELLSVVV